MKSENPTITTPSEIYDIDFVSDSILRDNAFVNLGDVITNIDSEIQSYNEEYKNIQRPQTSLSAIQNQLTSTMDALPAMAEKKKRNDMHLKFV